MPPEHTPATADAIVDFKNGIFVESKAEMALVPPHLFSPFPNLGRGRLLLNRIDGRNKS
jgi:hypothetical protein